MKKAIVILIVLCSFVLRSEEAFIAKSELIAGRFCQISAELRASVYFSRNRPKTKARGTSATLEDTLVRELKECQAIIDISDFNLPTSGNGVIMEIINRHPELFYVDSGFSYAYNPRTGMITSVRPEYICTDKTAIARMQAEIDEATENALEFVPENASELEAALALHDFLDTHCEYAENLAGTHIRNIYGALVEREAVCAGYAVAYSYLLGKVGIESDYVGSDPMNHAWNMIKVNGKSYHVDVTWDDPVFSGVRHRNYAGHENFLLDDEGISTTGHYAWDKAFSAGDSFYNDFFWKEVERTIPCRDGYAYVVDSQGKLEVYNLETGLRETGGLTVEDGWNYSNPFILGNYLLFNSSTKIFAYDFVTGRQGQVAFSYPASEGKIYGLHQENYGQIQAHVTSNYRRVEGKYYDIEIALPVIGVSLNPASAEMIAGGDTLALKATVLPRQARNQLVSWKSSDPYVARVSSDGVVTAVAPGTANITVTTDDGEFKAVCSVTVIAPVTGVSLDHTSAELAFGGTPLTLRATLRPSNATNRRIYWKSSKPSVATVDEKGVVTAVAAGETVITVTTDDGNYSAECTITVKVLKNVIVLTSGWNLVAFQQLPLSMAELAGVVFFECRKEGTVRTDSVALNKAYWIFSPSPRSLSFTVPPDSEEIPDSDDTRGFTGVSGKAPEWDLEQMHVYGWKDQEFFRITDQAQIVSGCGYGIE